MLDFAYSTGVGEIAPKSAEHGAGLLLEEKVVEGEGVDPLYEMIKDGDVGTLLPSTDDAAIQPLSLVLVGSHPSVSYINQEHGDVFMDQDLDDELAKAKEDSAIIPESDDPAGERNGLMAQIKVLNAMLEQVVAEEQLRALLEGPMVDTIANDVTTGYQDVGHSVSLKRQRRPNPKYFDAEMESDFLTPGSSPSMAFRSCGEELPAPSCFSDRQFLQSPGNEAGYKDVLANASATVSSCFDRCPVRSAGTHRARTALAQKPRVFPTSEVLARVGVKSHSYLDNLSIRELHEAYRAAFGRDTSVKDKHWLKRQIFMGSSKQNKSSTGKENSKANTRSSETNVKARLEKYSSAEVPLSNVEDVNRDAEAGGGIGSLRGTPPAVAPLATNKSHCKTLSLASLSPATAGGRENLNSKMDSLLDVENKEIPVGGKRLRKPNRRYIEDEGDRSLSVLANGSQSILSTLLSAGSELQPHALRLSWKSDAEGAGDGYRNENLRKSGFRASARSNSCHGRRSKHGSSSMKRKNEGRAAKLVKMAHTARVARHDADNTVRKVKFRLPAAPGQEKGEVLNGGDEEQVSCLLPVLTDESSEDYQIFSSRYLSRLEDTSDQAVATVPTANGGTRRKHHRPWTLREVVTLVEGVSRCGGGKWADIKKLAFSAVGYRTAVDLKDKWRNLLRASRAQMHPPKQGETRKKQFSASIPGHILAKVRELAALNNQMIPATNVGTSTSRSGQTVQRR